jgi:hypothetical protein
MSQANDSSAIASRVGKAQVFSVSPNFIGNTKTVQINKKDSKENTHIKAVSKLSIEGNENMGNRYGGQISPVKQDIVNMNFSLQGQD